MMDVVVDRKLILIVVVPVQHVDWANSVPSHPIAKRRIVAMVAVDRVRAATIINEMEMKRTSTVAVIRVAHVRLIKSVPLMLIAIPRRVATAAVHLDPHAMTASGTVKKVMLIAGATAPPVLMALNVVCPTIAPAAPVVTAVAFQTVGAMTEPKMGMKPIRIVVEATVAAAESDWDVGSMQTVRVGTV